MSSRLRRDKDWEVFGDNSDENIAESVYSFEHGERAYRIIVIRSPKRQMNIFEGRYEHRVIITKMVWDKRRLVMWHRACGATSENWIKELKSGFSLEKIPSGKFHSNAAFLQIIALAYNLVNALKVLGFPEEYRTLTVKSLRYRLFHLPAVWIRHARQWILKLSVGKELFELFSSVFRQPFRLCRT